MLDHFIVLITKLEYFMSNLFSIIWWTLKLNRINSVTTFKFNQLINLNLVLLININLIPKFNFNQINSTQKSYDCI